MEVTLEPVAFEDKPVLQRLLELYLYDFTEFTGDDLNEHGEFGYRYLDHYWAPDRLEERWPFFVRIEGKLAGFVLVRKADDRHRMAEFFVLRKHRRGGGGTVAAKATFARFPGPWEVTELASNLPAQAFWRAVVAEVTRGAYVQEAGEGFVRQRFTVG